MDVSRDSLIVSMKRLKALICLAEDAMGVERSLTPVEHLPRLTQPNGGGEAVRELWETRRRAYLQEYRATARFLGLPVEMLAQKPREAHTVDVRQAHGE